MLRAKYLKYILNFKKPACTSRGILQQKETWFIKIWEDDNPALFGLGECAVFRGLSCDDSPVFEETLQNVCKNIQHFVNDEKLKDWPSIRFGVETALLDLKNGGKRELFPSSFTRGLNGISINGLLWMGTPDYIKQQVKEKLEEGYHCIKFKVGTHVDDELAMLHSLRQEYPENDLEIRLDANGAFSFNEAGHILDKYSVYHIHSIEQPIKAGYVDQISEICRTSPIPIALDEELIGVNKLESKRSLLELIKPQYIILKPALTGGFSGTDEWIAEAKSLKIGWWITSALESNIGLNAIAQYSYSVRVNIPQGLGTGTLYTNNIPSPLFTRDRQLFINPHSKWEFTILNDFVK